ncbi:MAG: general secretion pathway protein GspK, partial [Synergistales bacterium]|nr:general secretion pathway protein GspK [Synergistales bacterium]
EYSWERIWDFYGEPRLGSLILDFLDRNTTPRLGSDERMEFLNRDLMDLSELSLIEEFPEELLLESPGRPALKDFFTLWSDGKINLNVVPVQVLDMIDGIDETVASDIMALRERKAITGFDDIYGEIPSFPADILPRVVNLLGFKSSYFRVMVEARPLQSEHQGIFMAVLKREGSGCRIIKWEEY